MNYSNSDRPRIDFATFWAIVSIAYALIFDGIEFYGSPVSGLKGLVMLVMQWGVVSVAASSVIGLLALNRRIFAILFPILIGLSSIAAYFKLTLGVSITPAAVELAAVNGVATWASVISPMLVIIIIAGIGAGISVAYLRWTKVIPPRWSVIWCAAFVIVIITPLRFVGSFRAPVTARMPYSFWAATNDYLNSRKKVVEIRDTFTDTPSECLTDSLTVLVVIGESLRPDHLSINGYSRPTTPHLEAESTLVSLHDVWTDACYTHLSVPRIMTRADRSDPDRAYSEQSFITLFRKAGFDTAWFSNQDISDTYVYFMHEADTLVHCNPARSLYDYGKWLDTDMLPDISRFVNSSETRRLAVIHTIGSHWWYRSHYPDSLAVFRPEIDSRIVSELSREAMINSYDNSILATSHFLSKLMDQVRDGCALIIFISDHGESLGEEGRYLHAVEADELHHTACFVWYSPEFARRFPEKITALNANSSNPWTTDMIFHSALDGASITTPALNTRMSIFQQ